MSDNGTYMRGDEILLVAEIEAASAIRKALRTWEQHKNRFPNSDIGWAVFFDRIKLRATNQDDAA